MTDASRTTAWQRRTTPLRQFLQTQTGGAAVLLGAVLIAIAWANVDEAAYERFWDTDLTITVADARVVLSLRDWINSGLMTFFFLVVGLEARREFDLGELRERRQFALPLAAGISGMLVPVLIFLAINAGETSMRAWGTAMSTDTALALGVLALVGRRLPGRARTFLLTVAVVDDFVALIVIAVAYSGEVHIASLLIGVGIFLLAPLLRSMRVRHGPVYFVVAAASWLAVLESGVDPIVVGLALGLLVSAYPARRDALERATDLFRRFREQPTPELARQARVGVRRAVSPNERLQQLYHPWTSYVIVPIFAVANAGVALDPAALRHAFTSPITLGILAGFVLGKPLGIAGATWLIGTLSRGRVRRPVGWAAVLITGTASGTGFTVSLLIANIALHGDELAAVKIGILAATLGAAALTWSVILVTKRLPKWSRARAVFGTSETIGDLTVPVDPDRDHIRGPADAPVTIVEYGDFECPYCGQAEPVVRRLLADFGDIRYVWRHLPLTDVHPRARLAALAAEAAAAQGAFWEMHDLLLTNQNALRPDDLTGYAERLGLDVDRFHDDLDQQRGATRISADVDSADLSGVSGTPTFFINDRRHYGAYDIDTLTKAVRYAYVQAGLRAPS